MKTFALRTPLLVFASSIFCLLLALFAIGHHLVDASSAKPEQASIEISDAALKASADSLIAEEARQFDRFKRGLPKDQAAANETAYDEPRARLCRMLGNPQPAATRLDFAGWKNLGPSPLEVLGDPCASKSVRSPMAESKAPQFYRGAVSPDGKHLLGGTANQGALLRTTSGEWQSLFSGAAGFVAFNQDAPEILYAAESGLKLKKSEDGGTQFVAASNGIEDSGLFVAALTIDPNNSQTLWAGGQSLWRTTDGAASWTRAGEISSQSKFSAIAIAPGNPNLALAATSEGFIYRHEQAHSANGNSVWSGVKPRSGFVSSLTFDPANPHVVYATYSTFGGAHVWRSFDAGKTWSPIDGEAEAALPDVPAHALTVDPQDSSRLYLATDFGLFVTADGGEHWRWMKTGFGADVVESLSVRQSGETTELLAFTRRSGVWSASFDPEQSCQYTLSASAQSFEASSSNGSVDVTAVGTGCAWTATSEVSWVTFTAGTPGSGNGKVQFNLAANTTTMARRGRLLVAGGEFIVLQAGIGGSCAATPIVPGVVTSGELTVNDCPSSLFPFDLNYADRFSFNGVAGQRVSVAAFSAEILPFLYLVGPKGNVLASSDNSFGVPVRVPTTGDFLALPEPGVYTIQLHSRFSNLKVGKYQVLLTIVPSNCAAYALSSERELFDAEGGAGRVQLIAPGGCPWKAIASADWVNFPAGAEGSGNNFLNFRVEPNATALSRGAIIEVGGRTLFITQAGVGGSCLPQPIKFNEAVKASLNRADCTYPLNAVAFIDRYSFNAVAGQLVNVRAEIATARAQAYLTILGPNGVQLAARALSVPAENDYLTIPATGTYLVEILPVNLNNSLLSGNHDYTLAVSTPPVGCGYSLNASAIQFNSEGGKTTVDLVSQSACAWQAISFNDWLKLDKASGSGNDKLELTVLPNTTNSLRQGSVGVNGKTIRVTQAGVGGNCVPLQITPGQTVSGQLSLADCPNPLATSSSFQSFADRYVFSGKAGEQVAFDQPGGSPLILLNPAGEILARNNGRLPATGNITLPADGNYQILLASEFSVFSYQFTFSLIPAGCSYSISPRQSTFNSEGGNGAISISTSCQWTATTNADWVTLATQNGSGNSTANYSVAANAANAYRTAVINVGGQNLRIEQAGANGFCTALPIADGQSITGQLNSGDCARMSGAFNFATPSDRYTFTGQAGQQIVINAEVLPPLPTGSNAALLGIGLFSENGAEVASGRNRLPDTGFFRLPATGQYTIQIEAPFSAVSAPIHYRVSLSQISAVCAFRLSSSLAQFDAAGGTGSVDLTTTADCPWRVRPAGDAASWVTITAGDSGNASGKIEFTVAANTTNLYRIARVIIGEQAFAIEQAGVGGQCLVIPITPGKIVGKTSAADCKVPGAFSGSLIPVDRYSFVGKAGDQIAFKVFPQNSGVGVNILNSRGGLVVANRQSSVPGIGYLALFADDVYVAEVSGPSDRDADYTLLFEQVSPVCGYAVSPALQSFAAEGGSGVLNLYSSAAECPWTAVSNATWITINGADTGKGSGSVNFTVAANTGATLRAGTVFVGGEQLTIEQAGASGNCAPVPIAIGQTVNGTISNADCRATRYFVPSVNFYADRYLLDFTAGQQFAVTVAGANLSPFVQVFNSDGVIVERLAGSRLPAANNSFMTLPATGKYVIEISSGNTNTGAYALSIVAPTQCAVSLTPSSASFERGAGSGSLNIVTAENCNWTASSSANWLTITSPTSGAGSAKLDFSLTANPSSNLRTGTIKVGDRDFTVRQAGASGSCAVTPITPGQKVSGSLARGDCPSRFGAIGDAPYADFYSFEAKAGDVVDIASTNKNRMLLIGPNGLPANGFANSGQFGANWPYQIQASGAYILEYSGFQVGDYEFTLLASQASCTVTALPETSSIFGADGGTFIVNVLATDACSWTANVVQGSTTSTQVNWVTVTSGGQGIGNGKVTFTVAPNNGQGRTANVLVGAQQFTIRQAAKGGSCSRIALKPGQPHSGTMTYSSVCADGIFVFDGVAGERISVLLDDSVYNVFMELYAPNGSRITATSSRRLPGLGYLTLPQTGAYVLAVDLRSNPDDRYTILLNKVSAECAFTLSGSLVNFENGGGAGSVSITTETNCPWEASAFPNWIKPDSATTGNGNGTINFTVAANSSLFSRSAGFLIGGQPFTIRQAGFGGICSGRSIAPGETIFSTLDEADCRDLSSGNYVENFNFNGKAGEVALISVSGSQPVTMTLIAPNGSRFNSEGSLLLLPLDGLYTIETAIAANSNSLGADYQLRLLLSAASCSYAVAPARITFDAAGGTSEIKVTAGQGCAWTARSAAGWLKIVSGDTGSGDGVVRISADANGSNYRQSSVNVAGRNIAVEQTGTGASCTPKPLTSGAPVSGTITGASCRAQSVPGSSGYSADFYSINGKQGDQIAVQVQPAANSFNTFYLSLLNANGALLAQTFSNRLPVGGLLTLPADGVYRLEVAAFPTAGYSLTLVSSLAGCEVTTAPVSRDFEASGGAGSFNVQTGASCLWQVANTASWITVNSGGSGTGNGAVNFTVAANTTAQLRSATLLVNGRNFTVRQAGTAGGCTARPITPGQAVAGSWTPSDCPARYVVTNFSTQADLYSFNAKVGERVAVALTTQLNDSEVYLTLIAPNGQRLAQINGKLLPRVAGALFVPADGQYLLEATYDRPFNPANYSLMLTLQSACVFGVEGNLTIPAAGGMAGLSISSPGGCDWFAASDSDWLKIEKQFGSGSGKVSFTVAPNTAFAERSATLTISGQTRTVKQAANSVHVSSASYQGGELARGSMVSAYGASLATQTEASLPKPNVAGTTVKLLDNKGVMLDVLMTYVSPAQVNYILPEEAAVGSATIFIFSGDGRVATSSIVIANVAPSLFAANSDGKGVMAGVALRVRADGSRSFEPIVRYDESLRRFVAVPIDLGPEGDQVYVSGFGSGFRFRSALESVKAQIGGVDAVVQYAGSQAGTFGFDQLNLLLPRSIAGRGEVELVLTVDGKSANRISISVR